MKNYSDTTPRRPKGFTLIEILVVIAIIVLLVSILTPTVRQAMLRGYLTQSRAFLTSLSNAANSYKQDTGYYPGQRYYTAQSNDLTGSQMLALACWGRPTSDADGLYLDNGDIEGDPVDHFMAYDEDMVLDTTSYVLSDQYNPEPAAMLYYPSIVGNSGTNVEDAFDPECNSPVDLPTSNNEDFNIINPNTGYPYKYDSFLLIAPGLDREYFTQDDITNFK